MRQSACELADTAQLLSEDELLHADVSRYEEEEEAEEGGHDVEVQEEGYHPDEEQQPEAEIAWAPAEPAGRDASPTRLELRAQGELAG